MYYLEYFVFPSAAHPERDRVGESKVCCFIERSSLAEADRVARQDIEERHWDIHERCYAEKVTEANFKDDEEGLSFYEQALTDKEVFCYHVSPRHPVFWITATIKHSSTEETAEAHYFLAGNSILQEGDDLCDPAFWESEPGQVAEKAAVEELESAGWVILDLSKRPCAHRDVPDDLVFYYDEAEESGSCLVYVHDREDPKEANGHGT